MKELNLFNELREAWESSTPKYNIFADKLNTIEWTEKFFADGEYNYILDGFTFCTPTLDPFAVGAWKPNAMFTDYSYLEFN